MEYTFRNLFVLQEYVLMLITSTIETKFLTSKLLKQGYYPPMKSEGYSFGVVRASVLPSALLSVRNHISVPIGQI